MDKNMAHYPLDVPAPHHLRLLSAIFRTLPSSSASVL